MRTRPTTAKTIHEMFTPNWSWKASMAEVGENADNAGFKNNVAEGNHVAGPEAEQRVPTRGK